MKFFFDNFKDWIVFFVCFDITVIARLKCENNHDILVSLPSGSLPTARTRTHGLSYMLASNVRFCVLPRVRSRDISIEKTLQIYLLPWKKKKKKTHFSSHCLMPHVTIANLWLLDICPTDHTENLTINQNHNGVFRSRPVSSWRIVRDLDEHLIFIFFQFT